MSANKILGKEEAWDNGQLGEDENYDMAVDRNLIFGKLSVALLNPELGIEDLDLTRSCDTGHARVISPIISVK